MASLERFEGFLGEVFSAREVKFEVSGLGRELSELRNAASIGEDAAAEDEAAFGPGVTFSRVDSRSISRSARNSLRGDSTFQRAQGSKHSK